ncbi:MAG: PorT family protein [Saprospiraceae bacterium]|nr:PorT family protein [Saprospiraceae bacterium]
MNKKCFFSAFIVCVLLLQNIDLTAQFAIGPKSGFSSSRYKLEYANTDYESYFTTGRVTGFHAGVVSEIMFGGNFGTQLEVMYSQKGTSLELVKLPNTSVSFKNKQTLNYIEIPLLFKYKVGGDKLGVSVLAGPFLGVGLGGKYTESGTDAGGLSTNYRGSLTTGTKVNNQYKKMDAGFAFGLGAYLRAGNSGKLILDARLVNGATNIINNNYTLEQNGINDPSVIAEARTRNLQLSIGYLFEFGVTHF